MASNLVERKVIKTLPPDKVRELNLNPHKEFIIAKAFLVASEEQRPVTRDDLLEALEEYRYMIPSPPSFLINLEKTSWKGTYYAAGGGVFGIGGSGLLALFLLSTSPIVPVQAIACLIITFIGLGLIIQGKMEE